MNNMPVLYRNIMDGLENDYQRKVFLWATERPENDRLCYVAEKFAREADFFKGALSGLLDIQDKVAKRAGTHRLNANQREDLIRYHMKRHANYRFGGNVNPPYARETK